MPLTFTAPIEQVPEPFVVAYQSPEVGPAVKVFASDYFPPMQAAEADWMSSTLRMTAEQAATLRRLAEAAYELRRI